MARPVIASDEDILQAAHRVLDRRGPDAFSIAEVAAEAGISRATIILRFRSTSALKLTLLSQVIQQFAAAIAQVPKPKGGDGLLHIAAFIGGHLHSRESSAKFFSRYNASLQDPELTALEHKRGKVLLDAISEVMPKVAIEHDLAVRAFLSQLTGNIIAWLAMDDPDSRRYLVLRTRDWLQLAGIRYSERLVEELAPAAAATAPKKKTSSSATPARSTPRAKRRSN
ncbi:TetR/AcrR family transcriptional regulator [Steroidobacter flavus]|uniref:TetR/AcrR family transcriptional regulator n=1 Tax=Steroidobacter flavus TaxID=1842136 RepID=A0ABV8T098_9GAMM